MTKPVPSFAFVVLSTVAALAVTRQAIPRATQESETRGVRVVGNFRVTTIADGLEYPWSLAFLPDDTMLVTERVGRLRVIRHGKLDPAPVSGIPTVRQAPFSGLMEVAIHPDFAKNQFVYLTYNKVGPPLAPGAVPTVTRLDTVGAAAPPKTPGSSTMAILRGRWTGTGLADPRDIFVADDWKDESITAFSPARMAFGHDGMLYVTNGGPSAPASKGPYSHIHGGVAQDPARHGGKVLRLKDDGTFPKDNPFVGRRGYKPEIYTMGHRSTLGLAVHPKTGAVWAHENGPMDGDEVNILKPGGNYGWPLVGMGRDSEGDFIGGPGHIGPRVGRPDAWRMFMAGMEQPFLHWTPTVAPSGMAFYTGTRFPDWQGSLLVGELKARRVERLVLSEGKGTTGQGARVGVTRRQALFEDLNQRIRDVRQGPDGLIYLLTDAFPGAVLKVEPMPPAAPAKP